MEFQYGSDRYLLYKGTREDPAGKIYINDSTKVWCWDEHMPTSAGVVVDSLSEAKRVLEQGELFSAGSRRHTPAR